MTKTAIVGCGGIAQVHAGSLSDFDDVKMTAFADIKRERAEAMAQKYGGNAYSSLEELLANEDIDVLHICTPHYLHTEQAALVAAKNIAVFTEKPPVISHEQWEEFSKLQDKVPVGICFQNRYNQSVQYIKNMLKTADTGALIGGRSFVSWHREAPYYTDSGWRGTWATEGGGVLINQSLHTLDLLTQFFGRADSFEVIAANHHLKGVIEVEDTIAAYIKFGNCPVNFYATTSYCTDAPVLVELCCENVTIRMEEQDVTCNWKDGNRQTLHFEEKKANGKAYWGNSHRICIRDFYDCLDSSREFPVSTDSVEPTISLMLDIFDVIKKTV